MPCPAAYDHELDLSELDARFKNDEVGASAYDPRVMPKIVLLAYSQGLISSRTFEMRTSPSPVPANGSSIHFGCLCLKI